MSVGRMIFSGLVTGIGSALAWRGTDFAIRRAGEMGETQRRRVPWMSPRRNRYWWEAG